MFSSWIVRLYSPNTEIIFEYIKKRNTMRKHIHNFKYFLLNENQNKSIQEILLEVKNSWIERYGSDAEEEAMYASCDGFANDVIELLNKSNIKFDLLNSITYTKRVGGPSGYQKFVKKKNYKNWYSKLPKELDDDRYFGDFEFPYHEWLYIDGKHYDFKNLTGADSVFEMEWMKDYFEEVKENI